jgi:hypothetical protein
LFKRKLDSDEELENCEDEKEGEPKSEEQVEEVVAEEDNEEYYQ